ncbi:MAG: enhanced serine sensitivity protein SseB C-terminal domain-containing protein [Planctomycetes bacterium]|nr:enhanced serine sensitivity protein SseB C-terminal domain-containing protein [Planctomycetota bacterium]
MFGWWKSKRSEPLQLELGARLEFVELQRGATEERLMRSLVQLFRSQPGVRRAYLARVRYATGRSSEVALCLVGDESDALHESIGRLFWAMFEQGEHLDVLFVDEREESELRAVCEPFHTAE